jgi:hypothetical protein
MGKIMRTTIKTLVAIMIIGICTASVIAYSIYDNYTQESQEWVPATHIIVNGQRTPV